MCHNPRMHQKAQRTLVILGALLYVGSGWLYAAAGLLIPWAVVPVLWAVWLGGMWAVGRLVRAWSPWTLAAGPIAVLFWMAFVSLGEWIFGWTA